MARGFVYLIQAVNGGPIKIGFAADPAARLRELQVGHPESLRVLVTLADDGGLERRLHRRFDRLRMRGEWFSAEGELDEYLRFLGAPIPVPPDEGMPGCRHLTAEDVERVRALTDPAAARELAEELECIRTIQARPEWAVRL